MLINFYDPQIRYLIDAANISQGLIKHQNDFLNDKNFSKFLKNKNLGFPLVLPLGIKYFDYSTVSNIFTIKKKDAQKYLFDTRKSNYIGLNIFFKFGNQFCSGAKIKNKYKKKFFKIINFNNSEISKINKIKKKGTVGAFQTRNIPHLGHELIIDRLLKKNKYVSINPLIGMKKSGDCKNEILGKIFKYFINLKDYKNKLSYNPIICNMHYAGAREAIHHCYIRENIGFDYFSIGRDHAGSDQIYPPLKAYNFVKNNKNKLRIKIFFHKGAYFCQKCNKFLIKNDCKHKNLTEISGTSFRKELGMNKIFKYARIELQKFIKKLNLRLFY